MDKGEGLAGEQVEPPGTLKGLERRIRELEAKNKRLKKELVVVGDVLDAKPGNIAKAAKIAVKAPSVHMKFNAILTARIDVCIEILSHAGIDRSDDIVNMVMDAAELIARRNPVD